MTGSGQVTTALRGTRLLLAAVGCLGIAAQLVLLRELMAAYGGNELSAGVTLTAWLLCEALGAWVAGRNRASSIVHRLSFQAALSVIFSLVAVPAAVLVRPLFGVLPGETLSVPLLLVATFAVVLLPAATHGALFVSAAELHARSETGSTEPGITAVGSAYVWEGVGTVMAASACFLLLNRLPSVSAVALSALPLIAVAGIGQGPARTGWTKWTIGFAALASLALLVFALPVERWVWSQAWRGQQVSAVVNSSYGKIVRLERAGQRLVLYDGLPVLAVPATQTERIEELSLLPVLMHPAPGNVLVLGSDLAIPAALARFRPDIAITTVQLDPTLVRVARSADSSLLDSAFSLLAADPVAWLASSREAFGCIILTDAVPSGLGSSRLFSQEFYHLCRSRLAPGGLLAVAAPGNPTALSPDLVWLVSLRRKTLAAVFDHVLPLAADFPLLLASDRQPVVVPESVLARLSRLPEPPRLLDSAYVTSLLDPFRQLTFTAALHPDTGSADSAFGSRRSAFGVSTAAVPRELFLNMVRENRLVSPAFGALYAHLDGLSPGLLLILGAALLLVGLLGARWRGGRFCRGFAVLTSGFSGAAASTLLLFAWQVRFGSVFSGVALLVAGFMLGTVLGGILGARGRWPGLFIAGDLLLGLSAGSAALLIRGGPAVLFLLANCLAGACLGFQFAVAGSIVYRPSSIVAASESAGRRAGTLTALDLVGGSAGGILTALVLVPVLGITAAALSAGAVKLASAMVQFAARR